MSAPELMPPGLAKPFLPRTVKRCLLLDLTVKSVFTIQRFLLVPYLYCSAFITWLLDVIGIANEVYFFATF